MSLNDNSQLGLVSANGDQVELKDFADNQNKPLNTKDSLGNEEDYSDFDRKMMQEEI